MTITRENYQIVATDLQGVVFRLNSVLARLADRIDKLEGLRGELETASGTFSGAVDVDSLTVKDLDDTKLHSME